jgi:hypothetical protein
MGRNRRFKTSYSYDADGNIKTLTRNNFNNSSIGATQAMDDLMYDYIAGTNKLAQVLDNATNSTYASGEIKQGQTPTNYGYYLDAEKFYNSGNNAAGTRVRKGMMDLKNLAQAVRTEVQESKNAAATK